MGKSENNNFDAATFLANAGLGRTTIDFVAQRTFFAQGDPADRAFYARLTPQAIKGKVQEGERLLLFERETSAS